MAFKKAPDTLFLPEEMTEAVHVACAVRGGASLAHGVQMCNVAEKLSM